MNIPLEQLQQHAANWRMQKKLPGCVILSGADPLLIKETTDTVYQAALYLNYERVPKFELTMQMDWRRLFYELAALSLFSKRRLITLIMPSLPNKKVAEQLLAIASLLDDQRTLLLQLPKLGSAQQKASWFVTLNKIGIWVPLIAPGRLQLPSWIANRLHQAKVRLAESDYQAGIMQLSYQFEGSLIALQQAIQMLALIYPQQAISLSQLKSVINHGSRFSHFHWVDSLLLGEIRRALYILRRLKDEGIEPIIIAWAINRELLVLYQISTLINQGISFHSAVRKLNIWQQRHYITDKAIKRFSLSWIINILQQAALLDSRLKDTTNTLDPWQQLAALTMSFM